MDRNNTSNSLRVCVIGLGYVGLPVLVESAAAGHAVVGLDVSPDRVAAINAGRSGIDASTDAGLRVALAAGATATTDASVLATADVVVVCVPTPLDIHQTPDLSAVTAATASIRDRLHQGMLVVLESTTYPGTTDTVMRAILEESGLRAGVDFALAFSPERIDPGNTAFTLRNTPKVVGGFTPNCTDRAAAFYATIVDTVVTTASCREAELAKLLENTYRQVNIALVNEIALICHDMDIDVWSAIDAASSKPFGFTAFRPGPGVGGHCIPVDPSYLAHQVRALGRTFRFVEMAQEINNAMPGHVVTRIQDALNERGIPLRGASVLLVGLTYKADVADVRESPAAAVIRGLRRSGAAIRGYEPYVDAYTVDGISVALTDDLSAAVQSSDIVVVLQHHKVIDVSVYAAAPTLFDTRGVLRGPNVERL